MYENKFSRWQSWRLRDELDDIEFPGVYAVGYSSLNLSGGTFSWRKEIIYVGMTNAAAGLKGRLKQFDNTVIGKTGHGGADRVRYKFHNYKRLVKKLYVAVAPFKCDPVSNRPRDLRQMGDVVKFEYLCLAHYVETFDVLPEFNNKKESPKYSLTLGRITK
ncbi:MAG TPA: hypothetical protein DHU55_18720 [Blastocatellia bacterium]|nr:hypothetical protein [Blastocatellia bacterium]